MSLPTKESRTDGRWRRRKEARPGEIVSAALEVFAERGFSATRLDDVAARAGITKGTLYLYFSNKEALFEEVVRSAVLPNLSQAETMAANPAVPASVVLRQILRMIGFNLATTRLGAIPKLMIAEAGNFPKIARFYLDEVILRGFRLFESILDRGIAAGEFRAMDVPMTARLAIAPMVFLTLWRNSFGPLEEKPMDVERFIDQHVELLMSALAAKDPRGPGAVS